MQRSKKNLNTIYISERVQECLRLISDCTLTAVVAPMGYGKTTAINWFLNEHGKSAAVTVVRISVYSDNLAIFWKSVQDGFTFAGLNFLNDYNLPDDAASAAVLSDDLCHTLGDERKYYIFLDDFHLLADRRVTLFLCTLANKLPPNVHLVVASRDRFLESGQIMRLGSRLHQITADNLRLNYTELSIYAHRCGTELSEQQTHELMRSTEGWFSAIYLNLRSLAEKGVLADTNSDIYEMFTQAMIDPLNASEQEFLAVMGLADEFTVEMAEFISKNKESKRILASLSEQNAFVSRLSDGKNYRFHHMMKECSAAIFAKLENDKQREYWRRYGQWHENHARYMHALKAYDNADCYDELLGVVEKDAGVLLSEMKPQELLQGLAKCPKAALMEHPLAILVLMRRLFTWREISKMLELKRLLEDTVREHPTWSQEERGNLLGECDLIMSFLMYNDITEMSRLHQSASARMNRPAVTIRPDGSWTFGSPSVLMMYYRAPGELGKEMAEMYECMPHYYKITNGHGQGAELLMDAEAAFNQGRFMDATIALEHARSRASEHGQENMALCCDFLALRMDIYTAEKLYDFKEKYAALLKTHNIVLLNMLDGIMAYYYAVLGLNEKVPDVFREHHLDGVNYFAPGRPMMEMIENQVYLAQGAYAKLIGRYERLKGICDNMHYALVELHLNIQTAAAYWMMKKKKEALQLLSETLNEAEADGFIMPFVENYQYIREIMPHISAQKEKLSGLIMENGEKYEINRASLCAGSAKPELAAVLTDRELEMAYLLAKRMSNKEIAEKLYLSEGTVKQYANQIYAKLNLNGDSRSKRKKLPEILGIK